MRTGQGHLLLAFLWQRRRFLRRQQPGGAQDHAVGGHTAQRRGEAHSALIRVTLGSVGAARSCRRSVVQRYRSILHPGDEAPTPLVN